MSQPDFEHYRSLEPEISRQTERNTIKIQGSLTSVTKDSQAGTTQVAGIDVEELQAALRSMEGQKVVYLTAPFSVQQGNSDKGWHPGTCVPYCDYEKMMTGLTEELKKFESMQGCYPFAEMFIGRPES
jgi:hypothetical protein